MQYFGATEVNSSQKQNKLSSVYGIQFPWPFTIEENPEQPILHFFNEKKDKKNNINFYNELSKEINNGKFKSLIDSKARFINLNVQLRIDFNLENFKEPLTKYSTTTIPMRLFILKYEIEKIEKKLELK